MARRRGTQPGTAPVVGGWNANDTAAEDRALQAYRLHVLGTSYRAIARQCGYSGPSAAMRAVRRARAEIVLPDVRAVAARQADRIERAASVVMGAIEGWPAKDKLWAVDRLVPLLKREAELFGLDATREPAMTAGPGVKMIRQGGANAGSSS